MEYQICVLLLITINISYSYHFYNPVSHRLLVKSSLDNMPQSYKGKVAPSRIYRRKARLARGRNGYCTDGGFTCNAPYDKSLTLQFECTNDHHCPRSYKCCSQKCFHHKICIKADIPQINNGNTNNNNNCQRPGQCEKWPYNCKKPYDYSYTYIFKCDSDKFCPKNFKCCAQNCFAHKICSRIVQREQEEGKTVTVVTIEEKAEMDEETTTESTTSTTEEITTTVLTTEEEIEEEYAVTADSTSSTTEDIITTASSTEEETEVVEQITTESATSTITDQTTDTETTTSEEEEETTDAKLQTIKAKAPTLNNNSARRTTPDSNAINPNYAEYYYNYDNNTDADDDTSDYNEYNYDDEDDNK